MSVKGASYLAVSWSGGVLTSLSRVTDENHPERDPSAVWREGNQLCAESRQRPKRCIDMAGGSTIYTVYWPRGGQIVQQ